VAGGRLGELDVVDGEAMGGGSTGGDLRGRRGKWTWVWPEWR
jgi:hypothetical protein